MGTRQDFASPSSVSGILTPKRQKANVPVRGKRGLFSLDRQVMEDIWRVDPTHVLEGVKVNDLSPLWPYAHLRAALLKAAQRFTTDMTKRGVLLLTNESDLRVWGPFESPDWRAATNNDVRAGFQAKGRAQGQAYGGSLVDFLIIGDFLATQVVTVDPSLKPKVLAA